MQLPFSKQLIGAALIAIVAPSATVIAAHSFDQFVRAPQSSVRFAQTSQPSPNPQPVLTPQPTPTLPSVQPLPTPSPAPQPTPTPPSVVQPLPTTPLVPQPTPTLPSVQPVPAPSPAPQPTPSPIPLPTGTRPQGSSEFERCVHSVLGDQFEALKRGGAPPTEEQKRLVRERCEAFKREHRPSETSRPSPPPTGEFPGRGEFPGQPPGGEFRGRVPERAPGAPEFGQPSGQPPGRAFDQQPGGPSREDQERFEREGREQRERFEREGKERMLQDMKRNLRGMEQGLAMMTRGLRVCAAANVEIPVDIKAGIERFQTTIVKVRDATNPDVIQDVDFSELPEIGDRVRETIDTCHRLRELPRISRQLGGEVRRIEAEARRIRAQAARSKLDVAEQLQTIDGAIANVKATLVEIAKVRTLAESESIMEKLEGMHETLQEIREDLEAIRGVLNVRRGITEAKRELRNAERQIAALKRQGRDTAALDALLAEGKALLVKLESLAQRKPLDVDALVEVFEDLKELGDRAEDAFAKITGRAVRRGVEERFGRSPSESIQLPGAFEQLRKPSAEDEQSNAGDLQGLFGF